jgi:hypothetical protein
MSLCLSGYATVEWLRTLCIQWLQENRASALEGTTFGPMRVVDGTVVKEPGQTGSQWRILYSLRLPSLVCDFFEFTAGSGEGNGESFNRVPVARHEFILVDAGYCSVAGIEYVWQRGADLLVRVNPQSFVAHSPCGERFALQTQLRSLSEADRRMAGCSPRPELHLLWPAMRGTEKRFRNPAGSSALTTQGKQETNEHQARDIRVFEIRAAVHDSFIWFCSRNPRRVSDALANRTSVLAAEEPYSTRPFT